jgi:hypothetical protein
VGPRAVLDAVVKRKIPSSRRESNPRTPNFQLVAQRYTDWAITALKQDKYPLNYVIWRDILLARLVHKNVIFTHTHISQRGDRVKYS